MTEHGDIGGAFESVSFRATPIVLPTGILQAVEAEVEYEGDRYLIGSFVDLSSHNENVLGIFPRGEKNQYLLIGRQAGQTCMDVTVNGDWEECIHVLVEEDQGH